MTMQKLSDEELEQRDQDLQRELSALLRREREIRTEQAHRYVEKLSKKHAAEPEKWELVEDWHDLRRGDTADVLINRRNYKPSKKEEFDTESWAGEWHERGNVYGYTNGEGRGISIHVGGSSFTPVYHDGRLQEPVRGITVEIWRYLK
jgi:hypothetical protein